MIRPQLWSSSISIKSLSSLAPFCYLHLFGPIIVAISPLQHPSVAVRGLQHPSVVIRGLRHPSVSIKSFNLSWDHCLQASNQVTDHNLLNAARFTPIRASTCRQKIRPKSRIEILYHPRTTCIISPLSVPHVSQPLAMSALLSCQHIAMPSAMSAPLIVAYHR